MENSVLAVLMVAAIVYLTRLGGYLIGLQVRHIGALRPILETLPGCAMMAIIVPAARAANTVELLGLLVVIGLMWRTNNVALATGAGLATLVLGSHLL